MKIADLEIEANVSKAVISSLIKKQILEDYFIQTDRVSFANDGRNSALKSLNEYQSKALEEILQSFENKNVTLLHGVTSSGKTEIYVSLLENCLKDGKQALVSLAGNSIDHPVDLQIAGILWGENICISFQIQYAGKGRSME